MPGTGCQTDNFQSELTDLPNVQVFFVLFVVVSCTEESILFLDLRDFLLHKRIRPREVLTLGTYLYSHFQSSRIIQQCGSVE